MTETHRINGEKTPKLAGYICEYKNRQVRNRNINGGIALDHKTEIGVVPIETDPDIQTEYIIIKLPNKIGLAKR